MFYLDRGISQEAIFHVGSPYDGYDEALKFFLAKYNLNELPPEWKIKLADPYAPSN